MTNIRLIDANALLKSLKSGCENCSDANTNWCEHCCKINDFEDLIDNAPTVEQKYYERVIAQINPVIEARPQGEWLKAQGEWVTDTTYKICFMCSECKAHFEFPFNFCPICGAKMRGGAE